MFPWSLSLKCAGQLALRGKQRALMCEHLPAAPRVHPAPMAEFKLPGSGNIIMKYLKICSQEEWAHCFHCTELTSPAPLYNVG